MRCSIRGARPTDFPAIREVLRLAFDTEDEARLWDYLVAHDPGLQPEGVRVAVLDDRPVACTVVLQCQLRSRHGWISGAVVTLVACDPRYQNQGYGGRTVRDALAYVKDHDMCLAVLYGHPGYYPRFGFAPVLPTARTTLAGVTHRGQGELREAAETDLPAIAVLYSQQLATYPCAVPRSTESWIWRPRHSEHRVLTLPDQQGYAFVTDKPGELVVHEATAADAKAAHRLLAALSELAGSEKSVTLRVPPDHLLARVAWLQGAEQTRIPATSGMAAISAWEPLLPPGYEVEDGTLIYEGSPVLYCNRQTLVQLVLGYRGFEDLLLLPEVEISRAADQGRLQRDFPRSFPHWSLAPYWY